MKVILLKELKGRGGEGDVIEVAAGFANNFLYPQKIAIPATSGNLKQLDLRKHNIKKREEGRLDSAEKIRAALEGAEIRIEAKVGEEGQLFGSVTSAMVAEAVQATLGIEVDKKRVDLKAPIKTAGEHEVLVSLYRDIKTSVKVLVGSAEAEAAPAAAAESVEPAEEMPAAGGNADALGEEALAAADGEAGAAADEADKDRAEA